MMDDEFAGWFCNNVRLINIFPSEARRARIYGIAEPCQGIEAACAQYRWNGVCWSETRRLLSQYRSELQRSLQDRLSDDGTLLAICENIVRWGGGERATRGKGLALLRIKANDRQLRRYLLRCQEAFTDGEFDAIARIDSMLTKIHALASPDALPIYDSRVAYAMASLFEKFARENDALMPEYNRDCGFPLISDPQRSHLPVGSKTSPRILDRTERSKARWCQAMVKLGKLLVFALRNDETLFESEGGILTRAHALEAGLFMMGYKSDQLFPKGFK